MTNPISRYMTDDHRRCDRLLAACEAAVGANDWSASNAAAIDLHDATLRHFALEEDILFPAVEQANPRAGGPTGVMRMEHRQMRRVIEDLAAAVRTRNRDDCLGTLETLHMLVQQHNAKEEGVLYPLCDGALGDRAEDLLTRMQAT